MIASSSRGSFGGHPLRYDRIVDGAAVHERIEPMKTPAPGSASPKRKGERQSVQVIARAASIMRALERNPDGLSLGEIAKLVNLSRSTVQRIVDALDRENLVLASSTGRGVRLGPALIRLAKAARLELREMARATMETLAQETGETVDLCLADNEKVVFVDQVEGTHRLMAVSGIGQSFPLHCSANGKAILAAYDETKFARLKKKLKLTRQTGNTIVSWATLEKELDQIRKSGVAYDREENSEGISAIAMTLKGPDGQLAAISMPVPTSRFEESEAVLVRALSHHCNALQERVGR